MEGIYQQDTRSLVKDVKDMFLREEILRSNKENVLTVKSDFLPLAECFGLILSGATMQD